MKTPKPEVNPALTDSLASVANVATNLSVKLREAHSNACLDNPTVAENLIERALLDLITEACQLREKINILNQCAKGRASGGGAA